MGATRTLKRLKKENKRIEDRIKWKKEDQMKRLLKEIEIKKEAKPVKQESLKR